MLFLALIISTAVIFFIRFFINNSLRTRVQRIQTFNAAIKAIYFLPVFKLALFMLCIALIYFIGIFIGFFSMFSKTIFPRQELEWDFLPLVGCILISALLVCGNFILAKISMNKKMDALNIFYKLAYLGFSAATLTITYHNLPLLYPVHLSYTKMVFYNETIVVVLSIIAYLIILLMPLWYQKKNKLVEYFQLSVRVSLMYIVLTAILAFIAFVGYTILKITV